MQTSNSTQSHSYIPKEAFLFFPTESDVRDPSQRLIFDGNTKFNSEETGKIAEFKDYLRENNEKLHPSWTDNLILRMLYASGFKHPGALASLTSYENWRKSALPIKLNSELEHYLNSGLLYISGRDHKLRPIVVMRLSMIDPQTMDTEFLTKVFTFWFEFIINECMLPGQVENWVFIVDAEDIKISIKCLTQITQMFQHLQSVYKCRLATLYIVNAPTAVYLTWRVIKNILDEVTVSKINFAKGMPEELFNIANREQVEQKYGGTAPNVTQYWPPASRSNKFSPPAKNLITEEEYASRYEKGLLKNMTINQDIISHSSSNGKEASHNKSLNGPSEDHLPESSSKDSLSQHGDSQYPTQDTLPEEPVKTNKFKMNYSLMGGLGGMYANQMMENMKAKQEHAGGETEGHDIFNGK